MSKKIYSFEANTEFVQAIESLKVAIDDTNTEVFARAVRLLHFAWQEHVKGNEIAVVKEDEVKKIIDIRFIKV